MSNTPDEQHYQSTEVIALVSDKWAIAVLHAVRAGHHRYGQLHREIEAISKKMLTQTLRKLERDGIISRIDYAEQPPRVEYYITDLGASLVTQLTAMCQWSKRHLEQVALARDQYDSQQAD